MGKNFLRLLNAIFNVNKSLNMTWEELGSDVN